MDILTKICVVVLVVVVLVASVMFVRLASVVPNWKYKFQQERTLSEMNAQEAASEKLAHKRTRQQYAEMVGRTSTTISDLQGENLSLQQALDEQKIKNTAQENKLAKIEFDIRQMKETDKLRVQRNKTLADQVTSLRESVDKANSMNTRLGQELRKKTAEYDSLELIARAHLEQISELEEALRERDKQLEDALAGHRVVAATAQDVETDVEITGTITAVIAAENVASINIGRAQGVREGMKMVIYRGDKLVGRLRIEDVELQRANGIIVEKQIDPMQGDKVATSATFK